MKTLMLVLAAIALASCIFSAKLWRELQSERQTITELRIQQEAGASARELPASAQSTAPEKEVLAPGALQAGIPDLQTRMALLKMGLAALSPAGSISEWDLLTDPEFRKARLTQLRIIVAHGYPGLADELGLSEFEANQFFELIAGRALEFAQASTETIGFAEDLLMQSGGAIRAQLGDQRFARLQEYQQTRSARIQAVALGSKLIDAGQPLSDLQARALTTVMIAEQQHQKQQAATGSQTATRVSAGSTMVQKHEDSLRSLEESHRRILDAAAPLLDGRQIDALREHFEYEASLRLRSINTARERDRTR